MSRCSFFLCSYEERMVRGVIRHKHYCREQQELVAGLVLDAVHPGNLGPLPPSLNSLGIKAVQIGLISMSEKVSMGMGAISGVHF